MLKTSAMTHIQVYLSVQQDLDLIKLWELALYSHPFIKVTLYLFEPLLSLLKIIFGID